MLFAFSKLALMPVGDEEDFLTLWGVELQTAPNICIFYLFHV